MTGQEAAGWAATTALRRAIGLAAVLLVMAALLGDLSLVVLAAPFVLGTALSLARRPQPAPVLELSTVESAAAEGGELTAVARVANPDRVRYDLAIVRVALPRWVDLVHGGQPHVIPVGRADATCVALSGPVQRWGRHLVGPARAQAIACDGLVGSRVLEFPAVPLRVYPVTAPFDAAEAMPRAAGLAGQHRSRRSGDGGELAGVREFAPGDRLRRVDWRVTLRTRQLHVAATLSDRDAEVVLLLDVRHEAGESGGLAGASSVLDTTVRAAAATAGHYLHRGDRVSLQEYGARVRRLRPASGRRQYLTVLEWLLDVAPSLDSDRPEVEAVSTELFAAAVGQLSANALVIIFTPLLDARSAGMVARLARAGRFVVAVDTLPAGLRPSRTSRWTPTAYRLWLLDRQNIVGQLREHGVPVVAWAGTGSLDRVLRDVSRLAAAPRPVRR